ncbi:MAG: tRNA (guanosine(37)-N1)-methyltransferase TrmD [Oscillospiraceae bacterium]|nr:tRNA (guanosine(37)-N1)-methyltransferase TrmD [Oscillospiraceae bacterium]
MRIDIMTLFPDAVDAMMNISILGRAQQRGHITIKTHQIRDYTTNKQMQVDDYPYGGGRGAVMQADPLYRCWEHICEEAGSRGHTIYMSPCGRVFNQEVAKELKAEYSHLILVCGHYEGIDQRFIDECVDEELSVGDFVVTGGEIPAMAVADAICRMVPGVLSEEVCFTDESHWNNLLEYPQYSRPDEWHGRKVPAVLLSGHHGNVDAWRKKESYKRTMLRRPDLFARFDESQLKTKQERKILAQAKAELAQETEE